MPAANSQAPMAMLMRAGTQEVGWPSARNLLSLGGPHAVLGATHPVSRCELGRCGRTLRHSTDHSKVHHPKVTQVQQGHEREAHPRHEAEERAPSGMVPDPPLPRRERGRDAVQSFLCLRSACPRPLSPERPRLCVPPRIAPSQLPAWPYAPAGSCVPTLQFLLRSSHYPTYVQPPQIPQPHQDHERIENSYHETRQDAFSDQLTDALVPG